MSGAEQRQFERVEHFLVQNGRADSIPARLSRLDSVEEGTHVSLMYDLSTGGCSMLVPKVCKALNGVLLIRNYSKQQEFVDETQIEVAQRWDVPQYSIKLRKTGLQFVNADEQAEEFILNMIQAFSEKNKNYYYSEIYLFED